MLPHSAEHQPKNRGGHRHRGDRGRGVATFRRERASDLATTEQASQTATAAAKTGEFENRPLATRFSASRRRAGLGDVVRELCEVRLGLRGGFREPAGSVFERRLWTVVQEPAILARRERRPVAIAASANERASDRARAGVGLRIERSELLRGRTS